MPPTIRWYDVFPGAPWGKIERPTRWRRIIPLLCGLALGISFGILPPANVPEYQDGWSIVGWGLFGSLWAGMGLFVFCYDIWFSRHTARYRLGLSEFGIHAPAQEAAPVPWSELRSIRERFFLQRLDLLGDAGRRLGRLEYQVADFEEATALLCRYLPRPQALDSPALFQAGPSPFDWLVRALTIALLALVAYLVLMCVIPPLGTGCFASMIVVLAALCGMSVFGLALRNKKDLLSVQLQPHGLLLRGRRHHQEVPFADINGVALSLYYPLEGQPVQVLDVRVVMVNGENVFVRPAGVDAVKLYFAIETARGAERLAGPVRGG